MATHDVSLADIIITPKLWSGTPRASNFEVEMLAMRRLAGAMSQSSAEIYQACANVALMLCRADTSGIRLVERLADGSEVFRWVAVAGQLRSHLLGMTTPRDFSPCGICVDTEGPLLLDRPERLFDFLDVGPPFHRALLVPLAERGSGIDGTIWVVSHNPHHDFDSEDARVLQRVAVFTATAVHMARLADEARASAAANQLAFDELDHRMKNMLQMVANILELNLKSIEDPATRAAIASARGRMLAMGRIHHIGSGTEEDDLSKIVRAVCDDLMGLHPGCGVAVDVPEMITLPAHRAALAALIVNELVTNAIKHAFRDSAGGTVQVALRRLNVELAELSVSDDGAPLPSEFDSMRAPGRGLGLVRGLTQQLGGAFEIDVVAKRFVVTFSTGTEGRRLAG